MGGSKEGNMNAWCIDNAAATFVVASVSEGTPAGLSCWKRVRHQCLQASADAWRRTWMAWLEAEVFLHKHSFPAKCM